MKDKQMIVMIIIATGIISFTLTVVSLGMTGKMVTIENEEEHKKVLSLLEQYATENANLELYKKWDVEKDKFNIQNINKWGYDKSNIDIADSNVDEWIGTDGYIECPFDSDKIEYDVDHSHYRCNMK